MKNSGETDLKYKSSLNHKKNPQKMPPIAKSKEVDSNTGIENTSANFNTLNYPEESINVYDTGDESK